jgi:CelD/BcsL family acetyltransferase involved in cellulose biosynthesis
MRSIHTTEASAATLLVARHTGPLAELECVWSRLVDPARPGAPFRTYPWISSWWKNASTSREPVILVARQGGEVLGLLPLYAERTPLGGRRLRFLGDGIVGSDYLGVLSLPEHADRCAAGFADHLLVSSADELQLDDLLDEDPLCQAIASRWPQPLGAPIVESRYRCPFVRTTGDFAQFLAALPDGLGAQWHRRRKWLQKFPDFRVEILRTPSEVARGMDVLFDLHRQRWALEGGSDAIDGPRVEAFHRDSARRLAELGWSRVYLLHVDGAPRAALYGWRHGDRFSFYQAGHEPAWRPRSVGTVLLGFVLQSCFEGDVTEFDFLRGDEPYKLRWATGWRETVRLRVRGTGLRPWINEQARLAWAQLRAAGKRALPPDAVAWVRTQKRAFTARRGGSP